MAVVDNWVTGNTFSATDENNIAKAVNGSGWLQPCNYATVGTETFTVAAGSVTGITGVNIDGAAPAVGARVLIKDAPATTGVGSPFSTQPGNGVYTILTNVTNITVARVPEMSGTYSPAGVGVVVMAGTVNAAEQFVVTTPNTSAAFTWGTGNVAWKNYPAPGTIVDLASAQAIGGKTLADTFMGQPFDARKLMRDTTLTASIDFAALDALKIPTAYGLKIPTTSSLKILGVVDPKKNLPGGFAGLDSKFGLISAGQLPYQELVFEFTKYLSAQAMPALTDTNQATQLTYTPDSTFVPTITTVNGTGRYTSASTSAGSGGCYLISQLLNGVTYMECDFEFSTNNTATAQRVTLVAWTEGLPIGVLGAATNTAAAHIVFGSIGYDAQYYSGGTQGTVSPNYGTLPGTLKQHVEVAIDIAGDLGPANTVYVRGADGQVNSFTWAGISGFTNNNYACCEITYGVASTDPRVYVERFAATSASLKDFGYLPSKARLLVNQGLPGKDVVIINGNPFQTRQAGQMTDPCYIPYPRSFARVRYCASGTTQVSTWTWKLTDKVTTTDVPSSSGTSVASATTVDLVGPFALATNAMPYLNIATVGLTPGLGASAFLVP